jgi:hypothetical protein
MTVMVASCWSRTQQLQVHGDDSGHMRRRRKIAGEDHATGTARVRSFWIRGPAAGNVTARSHDGNREKKTLRNLCRYLGATQRPASRCYVAVMPDASRESKSPS